MLWHDQAVACIPAPAHQNCSLSGTKNSLVLQAGCSAITNLCKQMPADAIRSQHDNLLPSLLPNLSHQHSRVRASSLAALDTLVAKVSGCCCAVWFAVRVPSWRKALHASILAV